MVNFNSRTSNLIRAHINSNDITCSSTCNCFRCWKVVRYWFVSCIKVMYTRRHSAERYNFRLLQIPFISAFFNPTKQQLSVINSYMLRARIYRCNSKVLFRINPVTVQNIFEYYVY